MSSTSFPQLAISANNPPQEELFISANPTSEPEENSPHTHELISDVRENVVNMYQTALDVGTVVLDFLGFPAQAIRKAGETVERVDDFLEKVEVTAENASDGSISHMDVKEVTNATIDVAGKTISDTIAHAFVIGAVTAATGGNVELGVLGDMAVSKLSIQGGDIIYEYAWKPAQENAPRVVVRIPEAIHDSLETTAEVIRNEGERGERLAQQNKDFLQNLTNRYLEAFKPKDQTRPFTETDLTMTERELLTKQDPSIFMNLEDTHLPSTTSSGSSTTTSSTSSSTSSNPTSVPSQPNSSKKRPAENDPAKNSKMRLEPEEKTEKNLTGPSIVEQINKNLEKEKQEKTPVMQKPPEPRIADSFYVDIKPAGSRKVPYGLNPVESMIIEESLKGPGKGSQKDRIIYEKNLLNQIEKDTKNHPDDVILFHPDDSLNGIEHSPRLKEGTMKINGKECRILVWEYAQKGGHKALYTLAGGSEEIIPFLSESKDEKWPSRVRSHCKDARKEAFNKMLDEMKEKGETFFKKEDLSPSSPSPDPKALVESKGPSTSSSKKEVSFSTPTEREFFASQAAKSSVLASAAKVVRESAQFSHREGVSSSVNPLVPLAVRESMARKAAALLLPNPNVPRTPSHTQLETLQKMAPHQKEHTVPSFVEPPAAQKIRSTMAEKVACQILQPSQLGGPKKQEESSALQRGVTKVVNVGKAVGVGVAATVSSFASGLVGVHTAATAFGAASTAATTTTLASGVTILGGASSTGVAATAATSVAAIVLSPWVIGGLAISALGLGGWVTYSWLKGSKEEKK
ncbi:MAG: hypothetical protein WCP39_04300 [Chlamydiota bacterium]